jgi:hypothetical protein
MSIGSFLGVRRPDRDVDHLPPSSSEIKEGLKPYSAPLLGLHGRFENEIFLYFSLLYQPNISDVAAAAV